MKERWSVLIVITGLVLGGLAGLGYAWLVHPLQVGNAPALLNNNEKEQYRLLIALSYAVNGDLAKAQNRLALLGEPQAFGVISAQAQKALAEGRSSSEVQALAKLASALVAIRQVQSPSAIAVGAQPGGSEQSPPLPTNTFGTPFQSSTSPTPVRTPTPKPTYVLSSQQKDCNPEARQAMLQIRVQDSSGQPLPALEIRIRWDDGEDLFFTGLKPEISKGYADFEMQPGVIYSLILTNNKVLDNLSAPQCYRGNGETFWGNWLLDFQQK